MYRAYLTRASSGEIDNTPVIDRILAARDEQSKLLGFSCFAEKSMASKVRWLCTLAQALCSRRLGYSCPPMLDPGTILVDRVLAGLCLILSVGALGSASIA